MNDVSGVIFDLDGTLYHKRWFFKPLLVLALAPHGLRLPAYMRVRAECSGKDLGDADALMALLCKRLSEQIRVSSDTIRRWIHGAFYPAFVRSMYQLRGSRPGLQQALASLRARGTRLAVLSDFACVRERLEALDIDPAPFDILASCEQAGALKPHPRPFVEIAHAWELPPEHIVVIGDRADTDGAGAANAGMQFIRLSPKLSDSSDNINWIALRTLLG